MIDTPDITPDTDDSPEALFVRITEANVFILEGLAKAARNSHWSNVILALFCLMLAGWSFFQATDGGSRFMWGFFALDCGLVGLFSWMAGRQRGLALFFTASARTQRAQLDILRHALARRPT